jgi:hypothetical protein
VENPKLMTLGAIVVALQSIEPLMVDILEKKRIRIGSALVKLSQNEGGALSFK